MSENVVGRSDIDALVAVGLAWGAMPQGVTIRATRFWLELSVDPSAAGERLWRENFDAVVYGGDPALMSEEERASELSIYLDGYGDDLPSYSYEAMPGAPSFVAGLRVISYYSYQTSGHWSNEGPTDISEFIDSLRSFGESMRGDATEAEGIPWGLDDTHRDFFLRF